MPDESAAVPPPLRWTRVTPTKAGAYFFRQVGRNSALLPGKPNPIILERNALGLIVPASSWGIVDGAYWVRGEVEWSGPIPPPEEGS